MAFRSKADALPAEGAAGPLSPVEGTTLGDRKSDGRRD